MKFVVLGTSEFTLACTRALLDSGMRVAALISMPEKDLPLNSANVREFAGKKGINYEEVEDINSSASIDIIKKYAPTYIFSTWPQILKKSVLELPKIGSIGTHPTALPFNRGRHPLHWLIALGSQETKLSFFLMDEGIDTGPILLQMPFTIAPQDDISDVIEKMNKSGYEGTKKLCTEYLTNELLSNCPPQDHRIANTWRKRTIFDVTLDPRMSTDMIIRTVRSFASPYSCANLIFENHVIKINKAIVVKDFKERTPLQHFEHGKILGVTKNTIEIKVDDGAVELQTQKDVPAALFKAKYIHPPSKYIIDWPEELKKEWDIEIKKDPVAVLGYHDGSAGQIETWFEEATGYRIACFVHEDKHPLVVDVEGERKKRASHLIEFPQFDIFKGRPLIVSLNWIQELKKMGIRKVLPLTPNNRLRLKQIEECEKNGLELVSAIHPTVKILPGAVIQPGVWINADCLIGYKVEIEKGVIINTRSQIDHHNVLKRCCQIDPGVVTAGNVTLEECCQIHTGSIIINRIDIGQDTIIGAGAVVTKSMPARCTAVGVPARIIKYHEESLAYGEKNLA